MYLRRNQPAFHGGCIGRYAMRGPNSISYLARVHQPDCTHNYDEKYVPVFPVIMPGLTAMLLSPSIPRWALNVALIVPEMSSYGAAPSPADGVLGAGLNALPNASLRTRVFSGAPSLITSPNEVYVRLNSFASFLNVLVSCAMVASMELETPQL